ncbi:MAG: CAP domain-containing protein [Planctomycetota bacterium]
MIPTWLAVPLAVALATLSASSQTERVREEFADGSTKKEYSVDKDNELHGAYIEYYEGGAKKLRASYYKGKLDGAYESWYSSGPRRSTRAYRRGDLQSLTTYDEAGTVIHEVVRKKGRLVLPLVGRPDVVIHPRTLAEIGKELARIDPPDAAPVPITFEKEPHTEAPYAAGELSTKCVADAMKRLNAFRYLSFVAPDIKPDSKYSELAQHAALVCFLNKDLSHTPPQPAGLPKDIYALGYEGAQASNLHQGQSSLREAIDGFMDDSDDRNIRGVGHRRWILTPSLTKSGMGLVGGFVALHVQDSKRRGLSRLTVSYPAAGYYPIEFLAGTHVAWHLSWDSSRIQEDPSEPISVECYSLDESYELGDRLEVRDITQSHDAVGELPALIFRPVLTKEQFVPGLKVLVRVKGLKLPKKESADYVVELFSLKGDPNGK